MRALLALGRRTAAQRVSQAGRPTEPAPPPARALPARVEDPYSATAAGGGEMTPAQIAEAQKMAREWNEWIGVGVFRPKPRSFQGTGRAEVRATA
jgi:hypothetical protein